MVGSGLVFEMVVLSLVRVVMVVVLVLRLLVVLSGVKGCLRR